MQEPIRLDQEEILQEQLQEKKSERIGQVTLDYSHYPGEDRYCDGAVEDELLEIAKNRSPVEYSSIIAERKNWEILYHLSPLRENIVEWIPMEPGSRVLEVGSGCGAITGALARKAGSVTCVELSRKRSLINAYRHSDCGNVTIHVGNFQDIEPELPADYDYICLIGVFEYAQSYIGGKSPYTNFLRILLKHLKPDGRIIIAIENKYGMKYFAGCKEDHLGTYFSGIENYAAGGGVRTFSRRGLERIFRDCGVAESHFYYPYPDYKFMTTIYSDAYLPGKGELSNNLRNFDRDRMLLFSEKEAFDGVCEDGLFPVFANSYVAVLGGAFGVKYAKYSNDRALEYAIRTEIGKLPTGVPYVRKVPLTAGAREHIRGMAAAYESLTEKYQGGELEINRCSLVEDGQSVYADFDFVTGVSLTEMLDRCLETGDTEGFGKLFDEYVRRIGYHSEVPVSDFDPVFSNILVKDDTWTLIDYEWTFGKPIDTKELAFRAVYCYLLEDEKRSRLDLDGILQKLGITAGEAEQYRLQEADFQKFVTGGQVSMAEIRDLIGHRLMTPQKWIERYEDAAGVCRVQIYEDRGGGYSEEQSYFVREAYQGENYIELELRVDGNVHGLRIDPAMDSCIVRIEELTFNGTAVPLRRRTLPGRHPLMATNGCVLKPASKETENQPTIVFATTDPNISLDLTQLERQAENTLTARMEIVRVPGEIASDAVHA